MNEPPSDHESRIGPPSPERPWDSAELSAVANGVFVGVGGVYAATGSVSVAAIAGAAAVLSILLGSRRGRRSPAPEGGNDAAN